MISISASLTSLLSSQWLSLGKRYERLLFMLLCLSLLWAPLPAASARPWAMMLWSMSVFGVFFLWALGYAFGDYRLSKAVKKAWFSLLSLGLIPVWLFIQSNSVFGWSLDVSTSYILCLLSIAYSLLFFLLLQLVNPLRAKLLLMVLFTSIVVQAVYGSMMVLTEIERGFFVAKQYFLGAVTGTFVNPNHFAAFLNLGLAIGVASLVVSIKELEKQQNTLSVLLRLLASGSLAWRIALVICVIALVMTSSRMGNLAFAISLLGASALYMLVKRRIIWVWIWLVASVFLVDALVVSAHFGVDRLVVTILNF